MKPMLFNTDMVRAILAGNKTVTRRVVKPQPRGHAALLTSNLLPETTKAGAGTVYAFEDGTVTSPPYRTGDVLYVRETFFKYADEYIYKASAAQPELWNGMWRPSIHMPREAARIFLRVTDVRAERLQSILDEPSGPGCQIAKEGCKYASDFPVIWDRTVKPADRARFGWDANPWVWVIEFERCQKPDTGGDHERQKGAQRP